MSMHKAGRNDPERTQDKTLKDYIDRKTKELREEFEEKLTEYEKGYQDGYYDAIVNGATKVGE